MDAPGAILDKPLRLEITKRLTDALKEITIANGYFTDLGGNVFRGRLKYGEETPVPSLSILEVPIPPEEQPAPTGSGMLKMRWEMMIQGWVVDDRKNPTDPAQYLMADARKRLALESRKNDFEGGPENGILGLGDAVTAMYVGAGVVRPPEDVSSKAYFWLSVSLDIVENLTQPTWA